MKRETIRCIKAGAADVANGINAKIAAVPLDAEAPADVRPAPVTLYTDIDAKWVARRRVVEGDASVVFPALAIFQFGVLDVVDVEVKTVTRDVLINVAFALLIQNNDPLEVVSDGQIVNRAVLQFLHWFMRNDQSSAFRTRNGIIVRSIEKITQDDAHENWEGAIAIAQTVATFRVRETNP